MWLGASYLTSLSLSLLTRETGLEATCLLGCWEIMNVESLGRRWRGSPQQVGSEGEGEAGLLEEPALRTQRVEEAAD